VIHDVDETLRAMVRRDALTGTDVDVVFDAPTKDWSSRRNAPTIDLYLYDLREDLRRREVGRIERREDDRVVARDEPPRWFKLSYLVTAWTQRPEDEHRLLASLLRCFLLHDRLPPDLFTGALVGLALPVPITCALPPPQDRALSDVWSALGGELKPSLDVVVVVPFDLTRPIELGPPVLEGPRLSLATDEAVEHRAGRTRNPSPVDVARARAAAATAEALADGAAGGGTAGGVATSERVAGRGEHRGRVVRVQDKQRKEP
jgi:hypothetical protein